MEPGAKSSVNQVRLVDADTEEALWRLTVTSCWRELHRDWSIGKRKEKV